MFLLWCQKQDELDEEEDSSLFFLQLPTKLPRPLPAFQRGQAVAEGGTEVSKGKGKAAGRRGRDEGRGVVYCVVSVCCC